MLFSRREVLAAGAGAFALPALARPGGGDLTAAVPVPFDHDRPSLGSFPLACEWGAAPNASLPTVLLIADAQQYYVRPGGAARVQAELFGAGFNVLAIVGRSRSDALAARVMPGGRVDWNAAYALLDWTQWVRDILAVIRHFRVPPERLGLYGRSGGAHLIHQFLALCPQTRARVYVQAAVNHELDVAWGVSPDRFWEEFSAQEPRLARDLMDAIAAQPEQRRTIVLILQRQHFFEPLAGLADARAAAVRAFLAGDAEAIAAMRTRYQIDAIEATRSTLEGVGGAVRVYEFAAPHRDPRSASARLDANTEALFYYATPLSEPGYRPARPPTDWGRLREQSAEILQVAGRNDHTCDYRTQIGLNGLSRGSRLVILDDNHVFQRWTATGRQPAFVRTWFEGGWRSGAFQRELAALGELRWREAG